MGSAVLFKAVFRVAKGRARRQERDVSEVTFAHGVRETRRL